jgi:hypothetical protein
MAGEVFVVENMRRSSRYRVQGGFPTRRDGGCACQWRPAIRAPVDVSQTSELLSSLHCTTEHFRPLGFFFRTPALHILSTMASRRTCINVLSRLEGISSRATGASPSLRTFSSKSSNWTCATRSFHQSSKLDANSLPRPHPATAISTHLSRAKSRLRPC